MKKPKMVKVVIKCPADKLDELKAALKALCDSGVITPNFDGGGP